jgi:hypothetical protein
MCVSRSTNLEFGAAEHFLVVRTVDGRILHASEACGGVPLCLSSSHQTV